MWTFGTTSNAASRSPRSSAKSIVLAASTAGLSGSTANRARRRPASAAATPSRSRIAPRPASISRSWPATLDRARNSQRQPPPGRQEARTYNRADTRSLTILGEEMTPFTVTWHPEMQSLLATIWISHPDQQAITTAADTIDAELAKDPY